MIVHHKHLHHIIVKIWNGDSIPQTTWKDANLITIYKNKGDKPECGNSRGIALLSVAGKVLVKIIFPRMVTRIIEALLLETQCGFRLDRSTVDMVFSARQGMEKCRAALGPLYSLH